MANSDFTALGIALGLRLLVGLQRERYHSQIAGIRTFTLITLLGSVSAILAKHFQQGWIIAIGGLSVAWLLGVANYLKNTDKEPDLGQTIGGVVASSGPRKLLNIIIPAFGDYGSNNNSKVVMEIG